MRSSRQSRFRDRMKFQNIGETLGAMDQHGVAPAKSRDASAADRYGVYEVLKDELEAKPKNGRQACESALREQGIDEDFLAKKLKNQLEAKNRRWNSEKKSWEEFDDCGSQLAALREICKIFGAFPSPESLLKKNNRPPVIIDISAIPRGK